MKKILLFIACIPIITIAQAQNKLDAEVITIDFDRALHFICSNTVDYVSCGSDYIEAKIIPEAKNIVSVVALEENFVESTNLIIITKAGEIHTYSINYQVNPHGKSVFFPDNSSLQEKNMAIEVNKKNVAHVVFENDIIYYKQGNEEAFEITSTTAKNIMQVQQLPDADRKSHSNLFCVDNKGDCFYITIKEGTALSYVYNTTLQDDIKARIKQNEESIENICQKAFVAKRQIKNEGIKKNKLEFSIHNLFVNKELFYFVFEIKNSSNIDLDIDFITCFFADEKQLKDAVQQEITVDFKQKYNLMEKVSANQNCKFVLVFDKFTIPDKKIFKIEIYERNGGRHTLFKIKNDLVIYAKGI